MDRERELNELTVGEIGILIDIVKKNIVIESTLINELRDHKQELIQQQIFELISAHDEIINIRVKRLNMCETILTVLEKSIEV